MNAPIPGTVHLIDIEGTSNLQHGKHNNDIILIPQPTNNPNDPLNWSSKRRWNSTVWQIFWTFFGAMYINGLTPAYLLIEKDTGIPISDLNLGNGLMYLFFAIGNFVTQPLALNFGRRPAAFFSFLITTFLVLWASFMQTSAEWYVNRTLIGIFCSGIECLPELTITDTKFVHERGFHMGFYTWSIFGGAFFAPIPAGFLADAYGWRWINRMYAILGIVMSIGIFFCFEETMFYRPTIINEFLDAESNPKAVEDTASSELKPKPTVQSREPIEAGETYAVRSYMERLKLWGNRDPQQPYTFFKFLLLPLILLRYPSIVFSGLLVGSVLAWYNVLLGTMTTVFGSAPYNFSANMIGLTYLACVIGTTFGCLIAGQWNDRLATWMARRNKGIKEPEARLWGAIVPLILHPAGCILYGVGAAHQIHWAGLCVGVAIVTAAIVMGATLALSYAVDCYKEIAGEAVITVILIRNIIGKLGFLMTTEYTISLTVLS